MTQKGDDWILTYTGKKVYPFDMTPEMVDIVDIAHALSRICRWTGHIDSMDNIFSVGQHSWLVSMNSKPEDRLWGLLHDASEAYLSDVSSPVKRRLTDYNMAERKVQAAICQKFNLPLSMPASVIEADALVLATEYRDLMPPHKDFIPKHMPLPMKIFPWPILACERRFLARFSELTSLRAA